MTNLMGRFMYSKACQSNEIELTFIQSHKSNKSEIQDCIIYLEPRKKIIERRYEWFFQFGEIMII